METVKVTLREKAISKGRSSLYLDFYPKIKCSKTNKDIRFQSLGIYILSSPQTKEQRNENKKRLQLANQIRINKENEINKYAIYTDSELEKIKEIENKEIDFLEYFEKVAKVKNQKTKELYKFSLGYLKTFCNNFLNFGMINEKFCDDFKAFLLTQKLKQNSCSIYFSKFKAVLRQSFKDGILKIDLSNRISEIKRLDTNREYLTLSELKELAKAPIKKHIVLKNAALFSALTGLRFSDIQKLVWSEIVENENNYSINFRQKKTNSLQYLPISKQAFDLLGIRKNSNEKVFEGLLKHYIQLKHFINWIGKVTSKHITFHSFRHTFATLQIELGTDIYTVSKMLGHTDLKTTQIYAKIVDSKKRKAANLIQLDI